MIGTTQEDGEQRVILPTVAPTPHSSDNGKLPNGLTIEALIVEPTMNRSRRKRLALVHRELTPDQVRLRRSGDSG